MTNFGTFKVKLTYNVSLNHILPKLLARPALSSSMSLSLYSVLFNYLSQLNGCPRCLCYNYTAYLDYMVLDVAGSQKKINKTCSFTPSPKIEIVSFYCLFHGRRGHLSMKTTLRNSHLRMLRCQWRPFERCRPKRPHLTVGLACR